MSALLVAIAPYLIVASLALLAGAALGYYTACVDEARRRQPRYRRVGTPE